MSKAKRKADERLEKRIAGYEDTVKTLKSGNASAFHRPGSRKKVY